MRLGHFDAPGPLQQFPTSDICSSYAIELSNNGPVQASALLKNIDSALPMAETGTIAVIGPNALLSKSDVSYYGPHTPCGAKYNTMVDAVQQHSSANVAIPAQPHRARSGLTRVPNAAGGDFPWGPERVVG